MKKFRLLMLDANAVIWLYHRHRNIWDKLLDLCEILLPETVAMVEVRSSDSQFDIDLTEEMASGKIVVINETLSRVEAFFGQFDSTYQARLDPGEREALAYLYYSADPLLLCSGDSIVFKILGNIGRPDQGLSLEEVLKKCGLTLPNLERQFTKSFRDQYTRQGQIDNIQSRGQRPGRPQGNKGE